MRGVVFFLRIIRFVQNRVIVHLLQKLAVRSERFRDVAVAVEDSNGVAIDVTDEPVGMALGNDIGIIAFGQRLQRLGNDSSVALIEQSAISVAGINDCPLVSVVHLLLTPPDEGIESPPVACGFLRSIFERECAEHFLSLVVGDLLATTRVQ